VLTACIAPFILVPVAVYRGCYRPPLTTVGPQLPALYIRRVRIRRRR
jgi:hypothetical protein